MKFPHEDQGFLKHIRVSIELEKACEDMNKTSPANVDKNLIDKALALSIERMSFITNEYYKASADMAQRDYIASLAFLEQFNTRNNLLKKLPSIESGKFYISEASCGRLKESLNKISNEYKVRTSF